jgi:hypothetical protein
VSFHVMRRIYSSLSREAGADRKVVADQDGARDRTSTRLPAWTQLTTATSQLEVYLLQTGECPYTRCCLLHPRREKYYCRCMDLHQGC